MDIHIYTTKRLTYRIDTKTNKQTDSRQTTAYQHTNIWLLYNIFITILRIETKQHILIKEICEKKNYFPLKLNFTEHFW